MPDLREIEQLIDAAQEGMGVEFKSSMNWRERSTQAKVIKAALAFANKRDGGTLIFGIEPTSTPPYHSLTGMQEDHYHSFSQDAVISLVNAHATPSLDLSVVHHTQHGKPCVVIVVREFADYPVLCSENFMLDGKAYVAEGRLYCRSRRMAETTEVRSADDMRDLVDLATAKGLERYFRLRAIEQRMGETLSAETQFGTQLRDLQ